MDKPWIIPGKLDTEIRKGIGTIVRTKQPVWLYAAMLNGKTLAYFLTWDEADAYLKDRVEGITKRHHV